MLVGHLPTFMQVVCGPKDSKWHSLTTDVYSADKVPLGRLSDTSSRQSRVCIVNCSTSLQPGSHFVALLIQADDILVLDSLALALSKVSPVLEKETAQIQEEN
jgi:hypothetical protein